MIDYLLRFNTEAAAKAALAKHLVTNEDGSTDWNRSYCWPVTITRVDGTKPVEFWVSIQLPAPDASVYAASTHAVEIDRDIAPTKANLYGCTLRRKFQGATAAQIKAVIDNVASIEPIPAGAMYPLPVLQSQGQP